MEDLEFVRDGSGADGQKVGFFRNFFDAVSGICSLGNDVDDGGGVVVVRGLVGVVLENFEPTGVSHCLGMGKEE